MNKYKLKGTGYMKENIPGERYKEHVRKLFIPVLHGKYIRLETGLKDINHAREYEII